MARGVRGAAALCLVVVARNIAVVVPTQLVEDNSVLFCQLYNKHDLASAHRALLIQVGKPNILTLQQVVQVKRVTRVFTKAKSTAQHVSTGIAKVGQSSSDRLARLDSGWRKVKDYGFAFANRGP